MATAKPVPSSPSRFSTGTRHAWKITCRVGCAFQPILRSLGPTLRPGASRGTTRAEMPFGPGPPVRTIAT